MNRLNYYYGEEPFGVAESSFVGIISGVKGAGKSSLSEPMVASAITSKKISGWHFKYDKYPKNNKIIVIDTELPQSLIDRFNDRIFRYCTDHSKITRKDFNNIYVHKNLVDHVSYEDKRSVLYETIAEHQDFSFVLIDNLSGLCDPLDKDGADELFQTMNASAKLSGGIVVAINHLNNHGTSRGWAGKKFEEQGSFCMKLDRDTTYGVTVVSSDKCRLGNLPTFDFSIKDGQVTPGPTMPFPVM